MLLNTLTKKTLRKLFLQASPVLFATQLFLTVGLLYIFRWLFESEISHLTILSCSVVIVLATVCVCVLKRRKTGEGSISN